MGNALVPELAVSNWRASRAFYCDLIGFAVRYERPEDGFSFLELGGAELMIDEIGIDAISQEAVARRVGITQSE